MAYKKTRYVLMHGTDRLTERETEKVREAVVLFAEQAREGSDREAERLADSALKKLDRGMQKMEKAQPVRWIERRELK